MPCAGVKNRNLERRNEAQFLRLNFNLIKAALAAASIITFIIHKNRIFTAFLLFLSCWFGSRTLNKRKMIFKFTFFQLTLSLPTFFFILPIHTDDECANMNVWLSSPYPELYYRTRERCISTVNGERQTPEGVEKYWRNENEALCVKATAAAEPFDEKLSIEVFNLNQQKWIIFHVYVQLK